MTQLKASKKCRCAKDNGKKVSLTSKLASGCTLDVTSVLPKNVRRALGHQQQMPWNKKLQDYYGGPAPMPKGKTVGDVLDQLVIPSGFDEQGKQFTQTSSYLFGHGHCYGLVGQCLESIPSIPGVEPWNVSLGETIRGSRIDSGAGSLWTKGVHPDPRPATGVRAALYAPEQGIEKLLTGGRKATDAPSLGAVALFGSQDEVRHAAFVLGRSQGGAVYVLQKFNRAEPYYISTASFTGEDRRFGSPTYFQ